MRISDWSSDVCSSDLFARLALRPGAGGRAGPMPVLLPRQAARILARGQLRARIDKAGERGRGVAWRKIQRGNAWAADGPGHGRAFNQGWLRRYGRAGRLARSEEHTSELQSLMRISYAVFCLKKKTTARHK